MAFNQTQFFEDLEKLTTKVIDKNNKEDFIFDFLTLLDVSKSTITSLKKNDGRFNVAANPEAGEVANKHRIYFKPVDDSQDLAKALKDVMNSPIINQHKIRMVMMIDFETVLINDTKYDETLDCDFTDLSPTTIQNWKRRVHSKTTRQTKPYKIPDDVLLNDVKEHPDDYQYERAHRLNCSKTGIYHALKRLGISQKKDLRTSKSVSNKKSAVSEKA